MRRPSRLTTSAARASAASCWASPARRRTASRQRCASWPRQSQISDRLDREVARSRPDRLTIGSDDRRIALLRLRAGRGDTRAVPVICVERRSRDRLRLWRRNALAGQVWRVPCDGSRSLNEWNVIGELKAATPLGGGNTLNGYIGAVAAIFWPSGHRRYWGDGECEAGREQLEGGEKRG